MIEDKNFYVSVVIPAYNASATIRDCLSALMKQTFAEPYEVIVVDDGSNDGTSEIINEEFKNVKLLVQKNAGPAKARNVGSDIASGEIIIFTDSDCIPDKNWLKEMASPFNINNEIAGVKGIYKTKQKELTSKFVQLEYEDKYDLMGKYKFIDFIDTYSAAFLKRLFHEIGGYDCRFRVACSEDVDLSFKLANKGYKMVFNSKAMVYHIHPNNLKDYLKKKYKFAYWRVLALKNSPNKAYKDSHTPQTMKLQLLLAPVIFFFAIGAPFCSYSRNLFFALLLIYFIFAVPFIIKALKRDFVVGLISPFFLFLRSLAQFLGIFKGFIDVFLLKKCNY